MRLKILILITTVFIGTINSFAQNGFRNPVKNETRLKEELFELEAEQYNHIFQAVLPQDNFLLIDFEKMSYWPETAALQMIFDIASKAVVESRDSFATSLTSKRIDVHVPVKNRPIQLRLNNHDDGTRMLVLNYDQQAPLKLGMDTIRVFKTFAVEKDKWNDEHRSEIQYTFILKDIEEIIKLADNDELIASIAHTFDSVVQYRRNRWKKEDTWYHQIGIRYAPTEMEKDKQLQVKKGRGFLKGLDANYYIGASLFRNSLTPYLEAGGSYRWRGGVGEYNYFRLSFSTLAQFERISEANYNFYNTSFANVELGILVNKIDTWVPIYETSIGFGYMFTDHPSLVPYKGMKMFFNYSLSPAVRITPDIYMLFKKGQENDIWAGITVSLKFF